MGKLMWILFLAFGLILVQARYMKDDDADADDSEDTPEEAEDTSDETESGDADSDESEAESTEVKEVKKEEKEEKAFVCNLSFKKIGCYADKGKKDKPLASFLESDAELGGMDKRGKIKGEKMSKKFNSELPKFACKCANDALSGGNAIFGLQNLAECWSGPDDSQYDKDGASEDCVTFDMAKCEAESEICAGKKHANFMYYVDSPEHTKTQDEVNTELAEEQKKVDEAKAKADKAKAKEAKEAKEKKKEKKKGKKSKKKKN